MAGPNAYFLASPSWLGGGLVCWYALTQISPHFLKVSGDFYKSFVDISMVVGTDLGQSASFAIVPPPARPSTRKSHAFNTV